MIKIIEGKIFKQVCLEDLDKKELIEYISLTSGENRQVSSRPIVDDDRQLTVEEKKRSDKAKEELRLYSELGQLTTERLKIIADKYGYHWRYLYSLM